MQFRHSRRKFILAGLAGLVGLYLARKVYGAAKHKLNAAVDNYTLPVAKPLSTPPNARLGINFNGIADWSTELPFVDVVKQSRAWDSVLIDGRPGQPLLLDEQGWIKQLPPGHAASKGLMTIFNGHYPAGRYTFLYDGEGEIEFIEAARSENVVKKSSGKIEINIDPKQGGFRMQVIKTNPANPIRNIRVIMPGFLETYAQNPWHPAFTQRWQGIACVRYMDMMATNNSEQVVWQDRPKVNDASFAQKGVPVEYLVDLANQLHCDAWFCMPHKANDDYIRQFAQYVKTHLKPELKAWVEYSNEVWNGGFQQNNYARETGKRLGLSDNEWEAGGHYTAVRSLQIFAIWQQVFGDTKRFVRVLGSQAANANLSRQLLSYRDTAQHVGALAIAPYISMNVSPEGDKRLLEKEVQHWSVDQVFDYIEKIALPEAISWVKESKKMADAYGVQLVAYEAGQHLVGVVGSENNEKVSQLLTAANADPRMGMVYQQFLAAWQQLGGDLICHFNSTSDWSKWGRWGAAQYYDEPIEKSPKLRTLFNWAKSRGQALGN